MRSRPASVRCTVCLLCQELLSGVQRLHLCVRDACCMPIAVVIHDPEIRVGEAGQIILIVVWYGRVEAATVHAGGQQLRIASLVETGSVLRPLRRVASDVLRSLLM